MLGADQHRTLSAIIVGQKHRVAPPRADTAYLGGEFLGDLRQIVNLAQRGARLEQTGGLLAEFQLARETAAEVLALSERLLRYLQRAPTITRVQAQFALREFLRAPEVIELMGDMHRASISSSRYADVAEQLPATADTAIDTLFDRLSQEREAAIVQMFESLTAERVAAIEQLATCEQDVVTALLASAFFCAAQFGGLLYGSQSAAFLRAHEDGSNIEDVLAAYLEPSDEPTAVSLALKLSIDTTEAFNWNQILAMSVLTLTPSW